MLDTTDRPSIEERYGAAITTTSLRLHRTDEDTTGAVDVLIAAGMSPSALGLALLRLHTEWTAAAKPKRLGPAEIDSLARDHCDQQGRPDRGRAKEEAARWYGNELRLLILNLRSRPYVIPRLNAWARSKGISDHAVSAAILHWLDPTCGHCDGHGLMKAPDAPVLSAKRCMHCNATGTKQMPNHATPVLSHISRCVSEARTSISRRLRR